MIRFSDANRHIYQLFVTAVSTRTTDLVVQGRNVETRLYENWLILWLNQAGMLNEVPILELRF